MRLIPIGHVLRHVVSESLHVLKTRVLVIKSFAASGARVEMNTSSDVVNHFHLAKGKVNLTKTRNTVYAEALGQLRSACSRNILKQTFNSTTLMATLYAIPETLTIHGFSVVLRMFHLCS